MWVEHEFPPYYEKDSEILILGTIPSPRSRLQGFYYGHPQNRFWRVLAGVYGEAVPEGLQEKKAFLSKHRIALWDVLEACEIEGAADTSIKNPRPNDIGALVQEAQIRRIITTGAKAYALYNRYCLESTKLKAVRLPSTSPANCAVTLERLVEEYRAALVL